MDSKCAIYLRVSSDLQDYERQIKELKKFAHDTKLSLEDENIYEDKLSGFKNEKDREGLNKLLTEAVPKKIKNVLVWEISRLARKHKDLLEITDFFQENGINVYFLIQRFWLLDETLKVSPQAGLSIAFFGWHGEYEARLTKERFLSAKKLNESLGKYNGGKIKFGYTLNNDNYYIVNTNKIDGLQVSEAEVIREVFSLYEQGLTCSKVSRICRSKHYPKIVCTTHTLARLLRDTSYIGYKDAKLGRRPTPPIIKKQQYDAVNRLIDSNKTKADKGRKHVYLLRGVLKCSVCGNYYVGKQTDDSYICPLNSGSNKTNNDTHCAGGNISISNIDGIIWERCKEKLLMHHAKGFDDIRQEKVNAVNRMETQIKNYLKLMSTLEKKRRKANIIFENDGYNVEEYSSKIKNINNEKAAIQKEIEHLEAQAKQAGDSRNDALMFSVREKRISDITDRKQIQTIIKSLITEVEFYKASLFKTVVLIKYHSGYKEGIIYNSVSKKGNHFKLFQPYAIRFDARKKTFLWFNGGFNSLEVKTDILRKKGLAEELPDKISIPRFLRIMATRYIHDIDLEHYITPAIDSSNSVNYSFDDIMKQQDSPNLLESFSYTKLTYFKDLNLKRFNRKS